MSSSCYDSKEHYLDGGYRSVPYDKFINDRKGLPIGLGNVSLWREILIPNLFGSYQKSTPESIRNWKPTKGKRALLCGVTYSKQKYQLKGTNYDVMSMRDLLITRFQFPSSSIHILAETDSYPHPTKRNIQEALRWLVKDNHKGDSLVFYFSGHGLRLSDSFNKSLGEFDECIFPLDFTTAGMILDSEINDTIVRPLKTGVKLHAIIDACHSGTLLDLPNVYFIKGRLWEDNGPPYGSYKGTSGGLAISIGACQDNLSTVLATDHTSAFPKSGKQMHGFMTYIFRKVLTENTNTKITYATLLASMHVSMVLAKPTHVCLGGLFRQRMETLLSSSEKFDVNEPFVL